MALAGPRDTGGEEPRGFVRLDEIVAEGIEVEGRPRAITNNRDSVEDRADARE